ncbi:hypothetical protein Pmani_014896 [Petrolisthes manimaculis]|uniref:Uncharacterized protein n=2 Tax=Petrolisthes manimaculis TaxID=1843537 RepID=A0AAE1U881_9EUCA|nr:hypothetical protein Pmani_014896 [Petrolisthes manimaculis]
MDYFKRRETMLNYSKLDHSGSFHQSNKAAVLASYVVVLKIAQQKKPHSIGETLVMPCTKEIVRIMLGEQHAKKLDTQPLSDNTVQRRIADMSTDIKDQVVSEIKTAPLGTFALQLDETTDDSAAKTLPSDLKEVLDDTVKMVNFVKSSALNSRLFRLLCSDLDSVHETLLYAR